MEGRKCDHWAGTPVSPLGGASSDLRATLPRSDVTLWHSCLYFVCCEVAIRVSAPMLWEQFYTRSFNSTRNTDNCFSHLFWDGNGRPLQCIHCTHSHPAINLWTVNVFQYEDKGREGVVNGSVVTLICILTASLRVPTAGQRDNDRAICYKVQHIRYPLSLMLQIN